MSEAKTRQRRRRGSINPDDIVTGAFAVARRDGLDQLSMPSLAEHLGVGVTSLYWYFRRKEDLLQAMNTVVLDGYLRAMPVPAPDEPWQTSFRNHFVTQRRLHREDELLTDLMLIRISTFTRDSARRTFELIERMVQKLVDAGFTPDEALLGWNAGSVYTRGLIIHDRLLRRSNAPMLDGRQKRMTDWSSMPLLAGMLDRPLSGTQDEDFAFAIDRLIDGLEVLLAQKRGAGTATAGAGSTAAAPTATGRGGAGEKPR